MLSKTKAVRWLTPFACIVAGIATMSCSAGDSGVTPPTDRSLSARVGTARLMTSTASVEASAEIRAARTIAAELRYNRARWVGKATIKSNARQYCAGVTALVARYLPDPGGVKLASEQRILRARRMVQSNPGCAPAASMNIFGPRVVATADAEADEALVVNDTLPDGQDAEAWANETFTEAWTDNVGSATLGGTNVDQAVVDVGVSLDGGVKFQQYASSVFAPYRFCGLVCAMKTAFVGGCIFGARTALPYARTVGLAAAKVGGPVAGIALAVGVVASGCVFDGTIASLIVYDLWDDE